LTHHASPEFWTYYHALPVAIREKADKAFELLKANPQHPSLHFKKVGRFWSARVGLHYRAVAVEAPEGSAAMRNTTS
jgi:hypothetical protein